MAYNFINRFSGAPPRWTMLVAIFLILLFVVGGGLAEIFDSKAIHRLVEWIGGGVGVVCLIAGLVYVFRTD